MSIEERINKDYVQAMKDRNTQRSSAVNYLRAMIKQVRIDKRLERIEDSDVVAVIRKQIKQRQDSIEQFEKGGRGDLAAKEKFEVDLMREYLSVELSVNEIKAVVETVLEGYGCVSIKDMGSVMKLVREKVGDRVDGRSLGEIVKERLTAA